MHNVALALLHLHLLLAERTKEVFHQPPVEKGTKFVDPSHLKISKVAHLGFGLQCSGHQFLVDIEIEKHLQFVAHLATFGHIASGQQYLALFASVEIHAKIHLLNHLHVVIISKF